uniref:Transmembrane ascorbate-dependent reductase CYB561 n=1 Tax=Zonotrichia albicollis TaxID=44394 RepID=A0A8D2N227_ZONAL
DLPSAPPNVTQTLLSYELRGEFPPLHEHVAPMESRDSPWHFGEATVRGARSHRAKGIPDMYSLHSWCGMATFVLYLLQWFLGCGFFLFPGASFSLRGWYKPQHIFFGITLFILSITSCLLGITEMLLFNISDSYSHFVPEGILANTLGVLLVAFGLVVGYVLTREEWKRPPLAEELALSMDFKTLTEGESPGGGSQ